MPGNRPSVSAGASADTSYRRKALENREQLKKLIDDAVDRIRERLADLAVIRVKRRGLCKKVCKAPFPGRYGVALVDSLRPSGTASFCPQGNHQGSDEGLKGLTSRRSGVRIPLTFRRGHSADAARRLPARTVYASIAPS